MTEMRGGLQAAYETVIAGDLIVAPTGTFTGSLGITAGRIAAIS